MWINLHFNYIPFCEIFTVNFQLYISPFLRNKQSENLHTRIMSREREIHEALFPVTVYAFMEWHYPAMFLHLQILWSSLKTDMLWSLLLDCGWLIVWLVHLEIMLRYFGCTGFAASNGRKRRSRKLAWWGRCFQGSNDGQLICNCLFVVKILDYHRCDHEGIVFWDATPCSLVV